jgi:hypothetical protein
MDGSGFASTIRNTELRIRIRIRILLISLLAFFQKKFFLYTLFCLLPVFTKISVVEDFKKYNENLYKIINLICSINFSQLSTFERRWKDLDTET